MNNIQALLQHKRRMTLKRIKLIARIARAAEVTSKKKKGKP